MIVRVKILANRKGGVLTGDRSHVVDKGVLSQKSVVGVHMGNENFVKLAQAVDDAGDGGREGLAYLVTVTRGVAAEGNLAHGSAIKDRVQPSRTVFPSIREGIFKTQSFCQHAAILRARWNRSAGQSSDGEMMFVRDKCNAHGASSVAVAAI